MVYYLIRVMRLDLLSDNLATVSEQLWLMVERSERFRDQEQQPIRVTVDGQNDEMLLRQKTASTLIALARKIDQNILISYCTCFSENAWSTTQEYFTHNNPHYGRPFRWIQKHGLHYEILHSPKWFIKPLKEPLSCPVISDPLITSVPLSIIIQCIGDVSPMSHRKTSCQNRNSTIDDVR